MSKKIEGNSIAGYFEKRFNHKGELPFKVEKVIFPKKTYLLKEGEMMGYWYFIVDGIIESGMNRNGENFIIDFGFKNQFFTAPIPMITRVPSDTYLMTVTKCTLERISYEDLRKNYESSLLVNRFLREILEQSLVHRLKKEKQIFSLSAEQTYLNLIKARPEVIKNITIKKIAKYLGIHPQSLSRIRKQFSLGE